VSEPFIFTTVGTDHHPFDRVVGWVDRWLSANAERGITGLIQTGTSARPQHAACTDYLGHEEMEAAVGSAIAVITHGGPGSIMLCSYLGKRPIVVPRQSALGEHVDDHQVVFSRRVAADGRIDLAETEERLVELLDRAVTLGSSAGSSGGREHVAHAVHRFERLANDLVRQPALGRRGRRLRGSGEMSRPGARR
jgi:UDP-N-acetylglucosamine transferase subunit ALG13